MFCRRITRGPGLDKHRLGELIYLIGTIGLGDKENRAKDILAHLEKPDGAAAQPAKRKRSTKGMPQPEKPQLDLL